LRISRFSARSIAAPQVEVLPNLATFYGALGPRREIDLLTDRNVLQGILHR